MTVSAAKCSDGSQNFACVTEHIKKRSHFQGLSQFLAVSTASFRLSQNKTKQKKRNEISVYDKIDHVSSSFYKMAYRTVKEWIRNLAICPACHVPFAQ
jgi:hypothetical protein